MVAKVVKQDESYQKIQAEIANCNERLSKLISKQKFNEIIEERLDPVLSNLEMTLLKLAYRQGLKDGSRFCEWLKVCL